MPNDNLKPTRRRPERLTNRSDGCEYCGALFVRKHDSQKVCSIECRAKYELRLEGEVVAQAVEARVREIVIASQKKSPKKIKRTQLDVRVRFAVLARDKFRCAYCGRSPIVDDVTLSVDHVIPVSKGGSDERDNLITACFDCNTGKVAQRIPKESEDEVLEEIARRESI